MSNTTLAADTTINLAENKPFTYSSILNESYAGNKANDGDINTKWVSMTWAVNSNMEAEPWYQVDLGKEYNIGKIEMVAAQDWDNLRARVNFAVYVSNTEDFSTSKAVASVGYPGYAAYGTWFIELELTENYRYVRAKRTNLARDWEIAELRVFETIVEPENIAKGKISSVSSVYSAEYGSEKGNDGSKFTNWVSNDVEYSPYFQVDLGKMYRISGICVVSRRDIDLPASRTNFEIQASNSDDFTEYTVLGKKTGAAPGFGTDWRETVSDSKSYRYVRLQRINFAGQISIAELKVFEDTNKIVNSEPSAVYLSDSLVETDAPIGTVIGKLTTVDSDSGDTIFNYSLVSNGDSDSLFNISGDSLVTNSKVGYQADSNYSVVIKSSDTYGASVLDSFNIKVKSIMSTASVFINPGNYNKIEILDVQGKVHVSVYGSEIKNSDNGIDHVIQKNVVPLQPGIYVVRVFNGNGYTNRKVIR
ncbi:MAG: discoidin domain-containing protein [Fibrobacteria bacterium]|nr:discoidin domain-containing protein [Fibrobacteria bacterium]